MTQKFLTVLSVVLLFTACNSRNEGDIEKIIVDLGKTRIEKLEDIIEKIDTISLETTPTSLIGSITKTFLCNDKIFIWDSKQNKLSVFSEKGAFLNNIGMKGRGGNEFIGLNDFVVNKDTVFLYDFSGQKMLKYKNDGSFICNIPLEDSFSLVQLLPNNDGFIVLNTFSNRKDNPKFRWLDYDFKLKHTSSEQRLNGTNLNYSFFQNGEFLVYWELLDDTIYTVTDKEVTPKYVVDFLSYAMPSDIKDITEMNEYYMEHSSRIAGIINNVIETKYIVAFTFIHDMAFFWALYNKEQNSIRIFKLLERNNIFGKLNSILTYHDGWFYGVYMPDELNINNNPSLIRFKIHEGTSNI